MKSQNFIFIIVGLIVLFVWLGISKKDKNEQVANINVDGEVIEVSSKNVNKAAQQLMDQAESYSKDNELVKAKQIYQKVFSEYSDYDNIEQVQKQLEGVNLEIILSNVSTEDTTSHDVVRGDTLGKLAKKYGTTVELIKRNNNLKNDIIRIGQKLRIWTADFNIFVDKSQNVLLLKKGEEVLKLYNVSTGENNSTPIGTFKVTTRLEDPVWFNRGIVVPPESPQNVLGTRWLGFDIPGYGIHGTVEPDTIGQQVTAGCVRMRNFEVEELFSMIPIGTQVVVVD